jgi:hypothetical protein
MGSRALKTADAEKSRLVQRPGRIREQVVRVETKGEASRAAEELIGIVHSYLT